MRSEDGGALSAQGTFAGKGEMAGLIRATDWSRSPLGPVETWPQSLRTAVSICLGSRHPIVLWWGPERWMFYNDGYRPMLGAHKHPQFLGARGRDCWAEIWEVIGPMMEQVIATGEATWSEDLFLPMMRSGYLEETYFTFSYSPIRDETGEPRGIFNACTESTARVLAERRMKILRELTTEARSSDEAARRCAEVLGRGARDVPFALVYLRDDAAGHLRLAGQAGLAPGAPASPAIVTAGQATGWPLEQVAAQGEPLLVENLAARFADLPREPWGEPSHQAMLLPLARPGAPGQGGVLVLGISPRRAFDDAYRGFFDLLAAQVSTAVSNARAYEVERDRAEKLAELDRAKTAFFNNVSHELRTPLTLILGPLEEALRDTAKGLAGAPLEAVHRNALRLLRLVNDLLDFSRVEAGRLRSTFEPTDLPTLTAGLAGGFQSLFDSAGLRLVVDCPPMAHPILVDRSQWEKVVLNLVSNAFKFTLAGTITVGLQATDGQVELSVSDTGTGIPAEELPKIFERFHRVEGAHGRSFEGTGIGLALVKEIARQHGGAVRVDSALGKGSTFVVAIPVREGVPEVDGPPAAGGASTAGGVSASGRVNAYLSEASRWSAAGSLSGGPALAREGTATSAGPVAEGASRARILVADDNADMRAYLVRLLADRWRTDAVGDGQAALEVIRRDPPDLVLSDVMMPRLDGISLVNALRADPTTSTIPVVLLSARVGEEAVVAGMETGADDYLVKPFSGPELMSRVGTHLALARARRAWALELEQANRELEAFSYSVSHDLRAPLRAIDGFSKALLTEHASALNDQGRHYLERVRAGTQRMSALIEDLLNLSRITRTALRRQPVDLTSLAAGVVEELRRRDPSRTVVVEIAPGLTANGDRQLLGIVLENLLGNAWKFTAKRSQARISFGSDASAAGATFFVRDNGAGFDMAYADRLFSPFQRLHKSSDFEGTGIGLATVQRIVSRHGGRLSASAEVEVGATFCFTLEDHA
jgi:signal transduction histidine kinase